MSKIIASVLLVCITLLYPPAARAEASGETQPYMQSAGENAAPVDDAINVDIEPAPEAKTEALPEVDIESRKAGTFFSQPALVEDCRTRMVNDRATLACVEEGLASAEEAYKTGAAMAQMKAAAIDDADAKRKAVRALASSALAFEAYREAECLRRHSLAGEAFAAHLVYLSCKAQLLNDRAALLSE